MEYWSQRFRAIPLFHNSIAQRSCKKYSTPSHEAGTKYTKKKNYDYLNLPLCSLWFLGTFVFEDFFAKNCVRLLAGTKI